MSVFACVQGQGVPKGRNLRFGKSDDTKLPDAEMSRWITRQMRSWGSVGPRVLNHSAKRLHVVEKDTTGVSHGRFHWLQREVVTSLVITENAKESNKRTVMWAQLCPPKKIPSPPVKGTLSASRVFVDVLKFM